MVVGDCTGGSVVEQRYSSREKPKYIVMCPKYIEFMSVSIWKAEVARGQNALVI